MLLGLLRELHQERITLMALLVGVSTVYRLLCTLYQNCGNTGCTPQGEEAVCRACLGKGVRLHYLHLAEKKKASRREGKIPLSPGEA